MDDFFASMVFLLIFALMIMGVGNWIVPEEVSPALFQKAVSVCEPNGGLKMLEMDAFKHDAECNNDAVFQVFISADQRQ